MNNDSQQPNSKATAEAKPDCAPRTGSAEVWRVTADDDSQKEWDSDNCDDAFIDAEQAFDAGARKVTIQRISPPNEKLTQDA
jgi:hypothetical protein